MPEDKLNKSAVRSEARQMLKEGKSRQATYEELTEKYLYGNEVADIIKHLPSREARQKYSGWNIMLLIIICIMAILTLIASPTIGLMIWFGVIIYGVATYSLQYYLWISILAGIGIVGFIAMMFFQGNIASHLFELISALILMGPMLILPIWLEKKLCPKPGESREVYLNAQGQQRSRIIYEFKDI